MRHFLPTKNLNTRGIIALSAMMIMTMMRSIIALLLLLTYHVSAQDCLPNLNDGGIFESWQLGKNERRKLVSCYCCHCYQLAS